MRAGLGQALRWLQRLIRVVLALAMLLAIGLGALLVGLIYIFGQALDPQRPEVVIWIVGEAKRNLTVWEINRFAKQLERARQHLIGEIFPVCFCYRARPEVQELAKTKGINLVFSYGHLEHAGR